MTTKTVWQTDDQGYLVGQTVADESPLEPGHFLIPFGAVDVKPPNTLSGNREWRWVDGAWKAVKARPITPEPTAAEKLAEFLRQNPDVAALVDG